MISGRAFLLRHLVLEQNPRRTTVNEDTTIHCGSDRFLRRTLENPHLAINLHKIDELLTNLPELGLGDGSRA